MEDFDEDPLDLLKDDGNGVIETVQLEDDENKPVVERTGCSVLILAVGFSASAGWWLLANYLT